MRLRVYPTGCGRFPRPASFFLRSVFLLLLLIPGFSLQAGETSYLDSLLTAAREKELAKDPGWHTLLHYKRTWFGFHSLVDDPRFFLSPSGKTDPQAELEATLRSFFSQELEEAQPSVCRFIGRYDWLAGKLNMDRSKLPVPECPRFAEILEEIKPASVTLIFPAAHINSPASMFGHTLLTVDTVSGSRLLAQAINYSAVTRETFGPLFAIKGLLRFLPRIFFGPSLLRQAPGVQRYRTPGYLGISFEPEWGRGQTPPHAYLRDGQDLLGLLFFR